MRQQTPGRRPIGRGEKVRVAVMAATLAELAETGYAGLTVESVAQRAGVHKTTVYRRWGDRETLVVDALSEQIAQEIPIPDTGTIESDLVSMARAFAKWATSQAGRAMVSAFVSEAMQVPEIADARSRVFQDRLRRARPVITRAIDRGELPETTDPAEVVKMVVAPLYLRLLVTGEALTDAAADQAARTALAAARAGALDRVDDAKNGRAAGRTR